MATALLEISRATLDGLYWDGRSVHSRHGPEGRWSQSCKNRTRAAIRILRNRDEGSCNSRAFRLSGRKSKSDAIGAAGDVEAEANRQTKYLQAVLDFYPSIARNFLGVWKAQEGHASIRWPSGLKQSSSVYL